MQQKRNSITNSLEVEEQNERKRKKNYYRV